MASAKKQEMAEAKAAKDAEADANAPASATESLSGPSQAAILLMALGEEEAVSILRHMEPSEVQSLGKAMSRIRGVSQQQIGQTLDDFVGRVREQSSLGIGSADWFRATLTRALGDDKAKGVLSKMRDAGERNGLTALKWMDASVIARIMRNEHPQTVATVLSQLPPSQAGEVLDRLPMDRHPDIIMRVSKLDTLHPAALAELDEIIEQLFAEDAEVELSGVGGVQNASEILNGVSKDAETHILDTIHRLDKNLANELREGMFIFENLDAVDDRGMQRLLREVPGEELILALKGASATLADKIFRNMSARAADILRDDLAAKGPVRLSEVEAAQREILIVAKRLSDEGAIALTSKGDEYV